MTSRTCLLEMLRFSPPTRRRTRRSPISPCPGVWLMRWRRRRGRANFPEERSDGTTRSVSNYCRDRGHRRFRPCAASRSSPRVSGTAPAAPRFFTPDEYRMLDALCGIILPADEEGGGAVEAGVARYIDTVVFYSDTPAKQVWRTGPGRGGPGLRELIREAIPAVVKGRSGARSRQTCGK